jgi:aspartate/methionine/tyrosine aminotransferase
MAIPGMEDRTIIISSFSKMLAWTGCRAGFILSGLGLAPYIERVPVGITSMPVPFQKAAVVALKQGGDFMKHMRDQYEERVAYCSKRLNEIPKVKCVYPEATFYVFPDISATGLKDTEFSMKFGAEERVRIGGGSGYGPMGAGHVRLALVEPMKNMVDAMDRFERFVKKL